MEDFFNVKTVEATHAYRDRFAVKSAEICRLDQCRGRILAEDIRAEENLPDFARATMDGYAIRAAASFGASEGSPAYLTIKGHIGMGEQPDFSLNPGEVARIATGGMLPRGADAVVMIEQTESLDETAIELYKSVAPGQHVIGVGEDAEKGEVILAAGTRIRPQEIGLLAAFGQTRVPVYQQPTVAIISTGDELVPLEQRPAIGQIRDINSYSLAGLVAQTGAIPQTYGIVRDDFNALLETCQTALESADMVLISGGSSVGARDYTIQVIAQLPRAEILAHGIAISPGKPTILGRVGEKAFWGLPGHVASAMVVFEIVVRPFLEHISGQPQRERVTVPARLARNLASAQGRTDFVRVRLRKENGQYWAEPVLGKSGLITTMVKADGLVAIDLNTEGLDAETPVEVILL